MLFLIFFNYYIKTNNINFTYLTDLTARSTSSTSIGCWWSMPTGACSPAATVSLLNKTIIILTSYHKILSALEILYSNFLYYSFLMQTYRNS